MDTQRLILFFVFSFSILMLWEAWQKEARPVQAPATTATVPTPGSTPTPSVAPVTPTGAGGVPTAAAKAAPVTRDRVRVTTGEIVTEIDTLGGDIVYLEFLEHKDSSDKNKNFVLLTRDYHYSVQSGLIGAGLPNHKTLYSAVAKVAVLAPGQERFDLRLEATLVNGVKVVKVLTFHRDSHLIDIAHEITNATAEPLAAHAYFQITRDGKSPPGDTAMMSTYTGAAVYTEQDNFVKVGFGDIDKGKTPYSKSTDNGWIGMVQHYFVTALLPLGKQPREFYSRKLGEDFYAVGVILPTSAIAPGATGKVSLPLYAGPQEQDKLKSIAPGLDLVVDYGWLTVIAILLTQLHEPWRNQFHFRHRTVTRCRKRKKDQFDDDREQDDGEPPVAQPDVEELKHPKQRCGNNGQPAVVHYELKPRCDGLQLVLLLRAGI